MKLDTVIDIVYNGFDAYDFKVIRFSCVLIAAIYTALSYFLIKRKARAWIVTLLSATVLSVFGCSAYFHTEANQLWSLEHIYGEESIHRVVALFFMSTNIMDLALGLLFYKEYLDPLTTVAHHIFYFFFSLILISHRYSRGILLCFVMEVPTAILALGTVWSNLRSDAAFGITFLATRLVYNVYLANILRVLSPEGTIWKVCCCVLCLHLYWFYKWIGSYGKRFVSVNSEKLQ